MYKRSTTRVMTSIAAYMLHQTTKLNHSQQYWAVLHRTVYVS